MFIKVIAIVLSIALLPLTPLKAAEIALPKPGDYAWFNTCF
jgi:hypothetical protein